MSDKTLTVRELTVVGEALFGPRWRTDVATSLGVTYRAIARWCSEDRIPDPASVRDRLRLVVRERLEGLEQARSVLWRRSHG